VTHFIEETRMEHRGLRRKPTRTTIVWLNRTETIRYRRFRTTGVVALIAAILSGVGWLGLMLGGGWTAPAWFAAILTVGTAALAILYLSRAREVQAEADDRHEELRRAHQAQHHEDGPTRRLRAAPGVVRDSAPAANPAAEEW
jgi:hypothetical protein